MKHKASNFSNRQPKNWRLFIFAIVVLIAQFAPIHCYSHPSPNTQIFLDVNDEGVILEAYLPLPELALVLGTDIEKSPETVAEVYGEKIRAYMMSHIKAYVNPGNPWKITIQGIRMDKGIFPGTTITYYEVVVQFLLQPQVEESTRSFSLQYDAIMHQVMNHAAFVVIRRDWEAGIIHSDTTSEASVIAWDLANNNIPTLEITLEKGSWWKGFKSMFTLGMHHIREGTDHLLFLLTLLLAAPLVAQHGSWGPFGGLRFSLMNLLKVVTAFTIGHSITLLAGAIGWIQLPTQPIEALIAVSILISSIHAYRPIFAGKEIFVAAGFGLIHGLAFASTLADLNLGVGAMVLSIFGFNIGIEVMQLFIVALIVPWLIMLSRYPSYRVIRSTGAIVAGIAAIGWLVERISGSSNFITTAIEQTAVYFPTVVLLLAALAIFMVFRSRKKVV